jgi:tetratricopeptide (TPR) repeat protein
MPAADQPRSTSSPHNLRHWLDGLLVTSMVAAASVLACQELSDADAWWHLRSGQWILENRHLPSRDPFSFASSDREWIDLHWGFQISLALAYRLGGVAGMILLASASCGVTLLIAMTARIRDWPACVFAAAWVPALLVMCTRLPPRPEVFSLAFIATYMAVLLRCDRRPALAWALPAIQILWVNSHGLFVLGPLILAAYLADGALRTLRGRRGDWEPADCTGPRWWMHIGLASAAVVVACLVNPYGVRGALFPLELFPKIGPQGGIYKANIVEFYYPSKLLQDARVPIALRNLFGRGEYFLLLMLPPSFLVPAIWAIWTEAAPRDGPTRPSFASRWLLGMAIAIGLTIVAAYCLPMANTPTDRIQAGRWASAGFLALGFVAAAFVVWRSPLAALLSTCGGVALASGLPWLRANLLGHMQGADGPLFDNGPISWPWFAGPAAAVAVFLTLRAGGRLFRILLAVSFGYLALQAVRNVNIFALIAGFVLASGLGEWAAKVFAASTGEAGRRWEWCGLATRVIMTAFIVMGTVVAASGRLPATKGWPFALGLRETPSTFAHEAARFAARPGMPMRCLAFDLTQAAVYLYHNSPDRKPFMDPRLEVATKETFETYFWLHKAMNEGKAGWSELAERMGGPSILLDHAREYGGEATVLADPRWRCVYFDAVASIFLASERKDLDASYPTIDFAARHFAGPRGDHAARGLDEALAESRGLVGVGSSLPTTGVMMWTQRVPILLLAGARAREALTVSSGDASAWLALGCSLWSPSEDLRSHPAGPAEAWDPARSLAGVQATYAFRRAIALEPVAGEVLAALLTMKSDFQSHGMNDARYWAEALLRQPAPKAAPPEAQPLRPSDVEEVFLPSGATTSELSKLLDERLRHGRPLAAVELARQVEARGIALPWELADRVAITHLHLGEPAEARRYWTRAHGSPSPALRLARIAQAELALTDIEAAEQTFRAALRLDHRLGEAWFGLALLELQLGDADATLAACQEGMACTLTEPQRVVLDKFKNLVDQFASSGRGKDKGSP